MTEVDTALTPDLLPKDRHPAPATYSATTIEETPPPPAAEETLPPPAAEETPGPNRWNIPSVITTPIEVVLGALGKVASCASSVIVTRSEIATGRAKPWLEFFDLSAFKPADSLSGYLERIRINGPYFLFNYVLVGLALSVFSVITKPIALIGAAMLIWMYFQFFGAETAEDEFRFFGFSLDTHEKIGTMVILGFIFFWITAGGFGIFFSVLTASLLVAFIHGCFRKPSESALADASENVSVV